MARDRMPRLETASDEIAVAQSACDLHAVHALDLRRAGPRPVELLRLALLHGEPIELYRTNLSANHLEAGVGTGFFIDRAGGVGFDRLALLDINRHCLDRAARRLARFAPELYEVNLLAPIELDLPPFASVGLTYVLHCVPGRMEDKLVAVDHLRPLTRKDAVLFGVTILGRGIAPNFAARALLDLYNAKGVFNNRDDDLDSLSRGLRQRFDAVEIVTQGLVAMFRAT